MEVQEETSVQYLVNIIEYKRKGQKKVNAENNFGES